MPKKTQKPKPAKRKKPNFLLVLLAIISVALAGLVFLWKDLPYQRFLAAQIKNTLAGYGLSVTSLDVKNLNNSGATLKNIAIGENPALTIETVNLQYDIQRLWNEKQLNKIEIDKLSATIYKSETGWTISGIEPLLTPSTDEEKETDLTPFFDAPYLKQTIPEFISLTNGSITANDENNISAGFPFDLSYSAATSPEVNFTSKSFNGTAGDYSLNGEDFSITAALDNEKHEWQGKAAINKLSFTGIEYDIPPLKLDSDFTATAERFNAKLALNDSKNQWRANAELALPLNDPMAGTAKISSAQFPWGGGRISLSAVTVPLKMDKPVTVRVNLQNIDFGTLISDVSDGKVTGTGKISGTIPITRHPNGKIDLQTGNASATQTGTIHISPELLAGDNMQMQIARAALENFHYTSLKIAVSSNKGKSLINLSLEGNNPEAFEGRPIKLNVNIGGDVMPLIQQTILPFSDVRQLLDLEETK